jgi:hypothetical protein
VQVLDVTGGEVIEDHDLVAFFEQPISEVRANEAGAACDQDLHRR